VDIADTDTVGAAVRDAEAQWAQPLTAVLHLAAADVSGFWDDLEGHQLVSESTDEFWRVFRPKVFGTWALRDLLAERPNTPLVLFSSVNGFFGGTSFGVCAAASSFLDGFADHWGRELQRPVRCLAWSAWADVDMYGASLTPVVAAARGFSTITINEGLASFLSALSTEQVHMFIGLEPTAPYIRAELDSTELCFTKVIIAYTASADLPPGAVERAIAEADVDLPVRCVRIATLPRNPGGTIDHPRLEAELARASRTDRRAEEPATDLEKRLAKIWEEVLKTAPIGRRETFFELGGSSLQTAELVAAINRVLGTRLSARDLYDHPTIASLANTIA
jgi:acyl carrier protein